MWYVRLKCRECGQLRTVNKNMDKCDAECCGKLMEGIVYTYDVLDAVTYGCYIKEWIDSEVVFKNDKGKFRFKPLRRPEPFM